MLAHPAIDIDFNRVAAVCEIVRRRELADHVVRCLIVQFLRVEILALVTTPVVVAPDEFVFNIGRWVGDANDAIDRVVLASNMVKPRWPAGSRANCILLMLIVVRCALAPLFSEMLREIATSAMSVVNFL